MPIFKNNKLLSVPQVTNDAFDPIRTREDIESGAFWQGGKVKP
jgi:hypothetical protein